jgi:HEAT repeat protein
MSSVMQQMEAAFQYAESQNDSAFCSLIEMLEDGNWRINYSAAVALENWQDPRFLPALTRLLEREDREPLYELPEGCSAGGRAGSVFIGQPSFPSQYSAREIEAWRRRGRVKHAVCFALAKFPSLPGSLLRHLEKYAVSHKEDHMVRAAASRVLGVCGDKDSLETLAIASNDEEWCAKTEATKARAALERRLRKRELLTTDDTDKHG